RPVDAFEPWRLLLEVSGRFRRAADAAHLGQQVWLDAELVHGLDQVVRDRVVSAAGAEGRGGALVGVSGKSDVVQGRAHQTGTASSSRSGRVMAAAGIGWPS